MMWYLKISELFTFSAKTFSNLYTFLLQYRATSALVSYKDP